MMSKFTTEVRYICETSAGLYDSVGFNDIETVLDGCCHSPKQSTDVFNFDFPIYDESYRLVLEKNILRHYYTREICEETVGLWKLRLQSRLNEIMPYYNKLYESSLIDFNPMYDVNYTTTHQGSSSDTEINEGNRNENSINSVSKTESSKSDEKRNRSKLENEVIDKENKMTKENTASNTTNEKENGDSHKDANNWDLYSDTPQGGINGLTSLTNNTYLTNARNLKDNEDDTFNVNKNKFDNRIENGVNNENENVNSILSSNQDEARNKENSVNKNEIGNKTDEIKEKNNKVANNINEYAEKVVGKRGNISYSKMLMEFRDTFLRIDAMIISELSDLFFGLWE